MSEEKSERVVEWEQEMAQFRAELRAHDSKGPWLAEPDRHEWRHKGVPCLIVRNTFFALCGYAAVPPGHPWHGMAFEDVPVEVHGGASYSDACSPCGLVCHAPLPGEQDNVWWLGFDCGHFRDYAPIMELRRNIALRAPGLLKYRTFEYVKAECESLAEQILKAAAQ